MLPPEDTGGSFIMLAYNKKKGCGSSVHLISFDSEEAQ